MGQGTGLEIPQQQITQQAQAPRVAKPKSRSKSRTKKPATQSQSTSNPLPGGNTQSGTAQYVREFNLLDGMVSQFIHASGGAMTIRGTSIYDLYQWAQGRCGTTRTQAAATNS